MPFTYALLAGIVGAVMVSSFASASLRSARDELPADVRDRLLRRELAVDRYCRAAEWCAFALIILGMFPILKSLDQRTRVLMLAGGIALFCLANTFGAWYVSRLFTSGAPNTRASRSAFRGALLITAAEVALLGTVGWIVASRLSRLGVAVSPAEPEETEAARPSADAWLDETEALKELAAFDKEYVQGMVQSGSLRTRTVAGKTLYNLEDVKRLKARKTQTVPDL